jgi:modulator of FtsH protease
MELTAHSSVAAERSVATIMGQVMTLVAAAIGLCALGTYLGRDLSWETARIFSLAGFAMLIVQWFVSATRYGTLGIFWLAAIAALIGFGLGPVLDYYFTADPGAVTSAAALTALTVVGMGAAGFAWSKDVSGWARPLSFIVLGAVVVSIVAIFVGGIGSLSPFISLIILVASALLILVDFNYVRKHATEDDVVWLATGIFVSIINIFLSLLNLFGRN